ncbi:hypothetical protein EI94DRAFT_1737357 [Lactarius quietus]|nr:hypothetical protein EI94DRAFT_1737357 [Lactarius quietus]
MTPRGHDLSLKVQLCSRTKQLSMTASHTYIIVLTSRSTSRCSPTGSAALSVTRLASLDASLSRTYVSPSCLPRLLTRPNPIKNTSNLLTPPPFQIMKRQGARPNHQARESQARDGDAVHGRSCPGKAVRRTLRLTILSICHPHGNIDLTVGLEYEERREYRWESCRSAIGPSADARGGLSSSSSRTLSWRQNR